MSRKQRWISLAELLFLLALPVLYFAEVNREYNALAPSRQGIPFADLAKEQPPPQWLAVVDLGDEPTLVWVGALARPVAIPSGRSVYVFDQRGRLIDWQGQTGEGGRWDAYATAAFRSPNLTLREAHDWIASHEAHLDAETP